MAGNCEGVSTGLNKDATHSRAGRLQQSMLKAGSLDAIGNLVVSAWGGEGRGHQERAWVVGWVHAAVAV